MIWISMSLPVSILVFVELALEPYDHDKPPLPRVLSFNPCFRGTRS